MSNEVPLSPRRRCGHRAQETHLQNTIQDPLHDKFPSHPYMNSQIDLLRDESRAYHTGRAIQGVPGGAVSFGMARRLHWYSSWQFVPRA